MLKQVEQLENRLFIAIFQWLMRAHAHQVLKMLKETGNPSFSPPW
jgi:hypothetical protein